VLKGILYIIASGLSFLIVNFFVKILGNGPASEVFPTSAKLPAHELILFRSIISFVISFSIMKYRGIPILGTNRKWLMTRGLSGMIALTMFFYTLHHLPLAVASTIQYLAPVFTVVLAVFIMKEKVLTSQWFFIIIALFGAFTIGLSDFFEPENQQSISVFWILIGILSAFFSGLAYNSISKLRETEETLNIVIYFPMLSIPIMSIWCLVDFAMPQGIAWLYILIIGVFTQIAQVALTKAYSYADANSVAPFQYLGSIYALLLGYLIFEERLSIFAIAGIILILVGVVLNILVKSYRSYLHK
jgi:drug/metabolite transporter (DMT)-like permease